MLLNKLKVFSPGFKRSSIPADVLEAMVEGTSPDGLPIVQGCTINDIQRLQDELKPAEGQPCKFDLPQELCDERTAIEQAAFFNWTNDHCRMFLICVDRYGCMPEPEHRERFLKEFLKVSH